VTISFEMPGRPATKGSWRPIQTAHGVVFKNSSPRTVQWCTDCGIVAGIAMREHGFREPVSCGVFIVVRFHMIYPLRGDIDKLQRALLDALTGIVYVDDKQVLRVEAEKLAAPDEATEATTATIGWLELPTAGTRQRHNTRHAQTAGARAPAGSDHRDARSGRRA
jgi:Holliday junction resolvase RusA-like endonuclease